MFRNFLLRRAACGPGSSATCRPGLEDFRHRSPNRPADFDALSRAGVSAKGSSGIRLGRSPFSSSAPEPRPRPEVKELPPHRQNPPDAENPDSATLQEQWRYATREYSKWYAHAWGTAIAAGLSFYALGWFIKGESPLSFGSGEKKAEETLGGEERGGLSLPESR